MIEPLGPEAPHLSGSAPPPPVGRVGAVLERRLAALRAARLADAAERGALAESAPLVAPSPGEPTRPALVASARWASLAPPARRSLLAERLAAAVGGEAVATPLGSYVRVDGPPRRLPVDRAALATIPGLPEPDVPFVCLDTETTGLATAAGTFVFLVGLARWHDDRLEQVQLLLPDQSDEPAFLAALRELIPPETWLVTYNGRSFDWPLLVARYRMGRERAPAIAGHLDLLPFVRRTFRHRLPDARLRTVERELLGLARTGDVDGWEIPGRYLGFLRTARAEPLVDVVRHNDEDVRSLGRLLAHVAGYLGRPAAWPHGHPGDLAALATALRKAGRQNEALTCLTAAVAVADVAGASPSLAHHVAAERARALSRVHRHDEAHEVWEALALAGGTAAPGRWIEVAKLREHRRRDAAGALEATETARRLVERSAALGRPMAALEADIHRRTIRLQRRLASGRRAAASP